MGLIGWLAVLATACAATPPVGPQYHIGQIIALNPPAPVSYAEFGSHLQSVDVIYIGEAHYTPSHVAAALQVLQTVIDGGRQPVIGMEMFSWDGQNGIDRYLNGTVTSAEDFLAESRWNENWGGHYVDYSPLVDYAKTHGLKLLGLNPPRSLVRHVVQQGLTGIARNPEAQRWPLPDPFPPDDPEYRQVVYKQIEQCHEGLSQEIYQKIYEASVFRDEGMASVITTAIGGGGGKPGPSGNPLGGKPAPFNLQKYTSIPSPPSFSWPPRESSPVFWFQDWIPEQGSRMTEKERHARHREWPSPSPPSFSWPPRESSPVLSVRQETRPVPSPNPLGGKPAPFNLQKYTSIPSPPSFSWPPRESSPVPFPFPSPSPPSFSPAGGNPVLLFPIRNWIPEQGSRMTEGKDNSATGGDPMNPAPLASDTSAMGDPINPAPFVSYTGAGHIQYGLPIPKRVQRQSGGFVKDVTVYLHALDPEHPEDVERLLKEPIADYVWLTALGPQGRQPRCGES